MLIVINAHTARFTFNAALRHEGYIATGAGVPAGVVGVILPSTDIFCASKHGRFSNVIHDKDHSLAQ